MKLTARRTGRGVPVVLVHGSGGGLDSWDPVASLLADEFELWTYSRRGFPPSGDHLTLKTFADDAADVAAVVGAVGDAPHLVGASYGATTALHAARYGTTVMRSVTVFEPPLFAAGTSLAPVLDEYRAMVEQRRFAAAARLFAAKVARVPAELLGAEPSEGGEPDGGDEAEAVGCLHDLEAMVGDDTDLDRWGAIDLPVMLIQGERTWEPMPTTMDALAHALPASTERVVLKGQSHFATHTAPGLFAETLRGFLRGRSR